MSVKIQLKQYAGRRLTRRLTRAMPLLGSVLIIRTLGGAIKRKGFFRGTLDTTLDFLPFIGTAKNVAEIACGRDLIQPKTRSSRLVNW